MFNKGTLMLTLESRKSYRRGLKKKVKCVIDTNKVKEVLDIFSMKKAEIGQNVMRSLFFVIVQCVCVHYYYGHITTILSLHTVM